MQSEIKITGGKVTLKPFVDRKTFRDYNNKMYEGVEQDLSDDEIKVKLPLNNIEIASDILILGCVEKIVMNEIEMPVTKETVDKLRQTDFVKILKACNELLKGAEDTKKKSSTEQEPTS